MTDYPPYVSERYRTDPEYRAYVDAVAAQIPPLTEERARIVRGLLETDKRNRVHRKSA